MKNITFLLALLLSYTSQSQTFEIEPGQYPYSDIIEWKGMGALLINRDPSRNARQVNLTLVGSQETSIWDQKFTPRGEDFYYISSDNARYVYFIDNLELINGKVYFSQLNSAGNVKSTSVSIGTAVKKLGQYDYNNLELINIVVTDKALVFHHRYDDKKSKSVIEIATFITHHNFLAYSVELGKIPYDLLKDEKYGHWEYIGFTGDEIYFAARDYKTKTRGWSVKSYTSKGKPLVGHFITAPEGLIPIENIGFGTTGKHYLEDKKTVETGLLTQINGKFYLVGGQRETSSGAEISLFELEQGEWKKLNEMKLSYFIEKKVLKLGIYPMNEGVGYHLDHNGYNKVSLISYTPNTESAHNDFTERTIYNPSSVFEEKKKEEFTVILPEGLLTFNTNQLNQAGAVKFEFKQR
ncbi:MAG: hypothetical protein QNK23_07390 [Crocinitomicaceae bacterium]|nr:hypothetical protein [Crocinitomicaceae bacterium]